VEIEHRNDVRLISRAMREGWDVPKQKVVAALMEVIDQRDPDLMMEAAKLLMKADEIDAKREATQQRELSETDDRRLQLLELAQRIPTGELAKLASGNSGGGSDASDEDKRKGVRPAAESEEEGVGARHQDPGAGRSGSATQK
jgi:hypothetical protein